MCGSIRAYQYRSTDGFQTAVSSSTSAIDDNYVDGVSLTHGNQTRQHIWTFAAGIRRHQQLIRNCPCRETVSPPAIGPPDFVGTDYFCDSGNTNQDFRQYFIDDPLWDGDGCEPTNPCCTFNTPPWFYKQLPQPTSDDIEVRVCADQDRNDEDIRIEKIHIFCSIVICCSKLHPPVYNSTCTLLSPRLSCMI